MANTENLILNYLLRASTELTAMQIANGTGLRKKYVGQVLNKLVIGEAVLVREVKTTIDSYGIRRYIIRPEYVPFVKAPEVLPVIEVKSISKPSNIVPTKNPLATKRYIPDRLGVYIPVANINYIPQIVKYFTSGQRTKP